ncbi:MAG: hypothetical protein PHU97_07055 [Bacteroidales bacterium]|jgi:hypothetical protein|nr:hypothetical protein [Bacteroidales bacterium]MDD2323062.1 hypothetical protein [Bacteroidales bacterium]MDD3011059.1 hypothetical protein [Bacteroidales bacterium]MDD3962178.1 hypothetical protein [Bacteroidales bacterium]MDY0285518.1 hypothetical protein [Bacteroidales bacterium]
MNKQWAYLLILGLLAFISSSLKAQTLTEKGQWDAGFDLGFLFANSATANFYRGQGENNIHRILGNFYLQEEIVKELDHTYDTADVELPEDMKYKPTISIGFHGAFMLADEFAIFLQANYARLKTVDAFLLHYNDIQFPTNTIESYAICPIYGIEERTFIDIGIQRRYQLGSITSWFFETGINFTNTLVKEHKIEIGTLSYSIKNNYKNTSYVPNTNYQQYDIRQGGIGWGTMVTLGALFQFNEQLSLHLATTGYYTTTRLTGYEGFRLHINPIVRLIFQNL